MKSHILRVLVSIVLLSIVVPPAATAKPVIVASVGKDQLAFIGNQSGSQNQVCTVDIDGGNLKRLTDVTKSALQPSFSSDGKTLAFIDGTTLWTMDANGKGSIKAAKDIQSSYAWAPDGKHIIYPVINSPAIKMTPLDGSDSVTLPINGGRLSIAPDGLHMSFFDGLYFKVSEFPPTTNSDMGFVLDARGEKAHLHQGDPRTYWSNDSAMVLLPADGNISQFSLVSGKTIDLTESPSDNAAPCWSLDSKRIAFSSNRHGRYDIFIMDASGNNETSLTKDAGNNTSPLWTSDGRIVFLSDRDDGKLTKLYIMNADGSNQKRLTTSAMGSESQPSIYRPK